MPSDLVAVVAEEFGPAADPVAAAGSASGAGVYRARTARGREVYLKVTPAEPGQPAPPAAHRELSFYREPVPALPVRSPRLLGAVDDDRGVALLPLLRRVGRDVVGGRSVLLRGSVRALGSGAGRSGDLSWMNQRRLSRWR